MSTKAMIEVGKASDCSFYAFGNDAISSEKKMMTSWIKHLIQKKDLLHTQNLSNHQLWFLIMSRTMHKNLANKHGKYDLTGHGILKVYLNPNLSGLVEAKRAKIERSRQKLREKSEEDQEPK